MPGDRWDLTCIALVKAPIGSNMKTPLAGGEKLYKEVVKKIIKFNIPPTTLNGI